MSLRARLAWSYGIAVALAIVLLAIASIVAIDRSLRSSLDARLTTAATAAVAIVDVHDGRISLDAEDRENLLGALAGVMDAAVFTSDGRVFTTSAQRVPSEIPAVAKRSSAARELLTAGTGDREVRVALAPVQRDGNLYGTVAVWQPSDFIDEFDKFAILAMALTALGVGGVVVMLSSTLARRALAPLERFTALATEIEAHDLSRRVGSHGRDELGRLGSAFDRMLDRLESAFTRQRRFTADASHELRAPLAVIRAEADVALGKERAPDEYRRALHTIVQEVHRIDTLVDALLVAARADSGRLRFDPVDVGAIAMLTAERFGPAAAERHLRIGVDACEAVVSGDAPALERALAAIVHNALDFAQSRIDVRVRRSGEAFEIVVEDDGAGFSAEGLAHATERFWRGGSARGRGATGLGLSIADAIVLAHGGRIVLENASPRGARVTIVLPFIEASSAAATIDV